MRDQTENLIVAKDQIQNQRRTNFNWKEVAITLADIKETFGFIPTLTNNLTDQSLPGAWNELKALRFNPNTALDVKLKGLIGLAVSTQIPCEMISYFEQRSTLADGATRQEQLEAVMMTSITRHWSTMLNGLQIEKLEFRKEADRVMSFVKKMIENSGNKIPDEEIFLVKPITADETYQDIEKTFGLVPQFFGFFPREGISGAWSEFKGLQLNPHTALNGKQKELIGLAVAAQIPCDYCIYFHRLAAKLNGASEREMQEANSLAAIARKWSTILHGPQIDPVNFKKETDQIILNSTQQRLQ